MSKHTFTPGPWVFEDRGSKYIVHKPGEGYITRDICRMDGSTMSAFAQEANARLIAAAPDLLEALRQLTVTATRYLPEYNENPLIQQAEAALAAATGEQK